MWSDLITEGNSLIQSEGPAYLSSESDWLDDHSTEEKIHLKWKGIPVVQSFYYSRTQSHSQPYSTPWSISHHPSGPKFYPLSVRKSATSPNNSSSMKARLLDYSLALKLVVCIISLFFTFFTAIPLRISGWRTWFLASISHNKPMRKMRLTEQVTGPKSPRKLHG